MWKNQKLLIDTGDTLNKLRENNSEKLEKYIELLKEYYKQENKKKENSFLLFLIFLIKFFFKKYFCYFEHFS